MFLQEHSKCSDGKARADRHATCWLSGAGRAAPEALGRGECARALSGWERRADSALVSTLARRTSGSRLLGLSALHFVNV